MLEVKYALATILRRCSCVCISNKIFLSKRSGAHPGLDPDQGCRNCISGTGSGSGMQIRDWIRIRGADQGLDPDQGCRSGTGSGSGVRIRDWIRIRGADQRPDPDQECGTGPGSGVRIQTGSGSGVRTGSGSGYARLEVIKWHDGHTSLPKKSPGVANLFSRLISMLKKESLN